MNSSVAMPSLAGVSLVKAAVLSTELGMTIMSPERVRTTVCRQVMSCTVPVTP